MVSASLKPTNTYVLRGAQHYVSFDCEPDRDVLPAASKIVTSGLPIS